MFILVTSIVHIVILLLVAIKLDYQESDDDVPNFFESWWTVFIPVWIVLGFNLFVSCCFGETSAEDAIDEEESEESREGSKGDSGKCVEALIYLATALIFCAKLEHDQNSSDNNDFSAFWVICPIIFLPVRFHALFSMVVILFVLSQTCFK